MLRKRDLWFALLVVVLLVSAIWLSRGHLKLSGDWASEPLPLQFPSLAVQEPELVGPSSWAYFSWDTGEELTFRFSRLEAGDLLKIKAKAEASPCVVNVILDGQTLTQLSFPQDFLEHRVLLPRGGKRLAFAAEGQPCRLHFSRIKRQAFVATTGKDWGEAYLVSRLQAQGFPAPWNYVWPPAVLSLLLGWWVGRRLLQQVWISWLPAVSAGLLVGVHGLSWGRGLVPSYPLESLWWFWLGPVSLGFVSVLLFLLVRKGERLLRSFFRWLEDRKKSWAWPRALQRPVPPAPLLGALVLLYAGWLLLTLPQSPMEWDEVNFLKGLKHFDVSRHAPHPPGYPIFIALSKLFYSLGVPWEHAPQLSSVVGALLAILGVFWLLRGLGVLPVIATAVGLVCLPTFAVSANFGLSDMLGAGLLACTLGSLKDFWEQESPGKAFETGALTALAMGCRPPLMLGLLFPWGLVVASFLRHRRFSWIWALPGFVVVSVAIWMPTLMLTGWQRYLAATREIAHWMSAHEYLSRFPAMEISRFFRDWLLRPLGSDPLALAFWLSIGLGMYLLWKHGQKRLVLLSALGGVGYMLLGPWVMTAEAVVRYALPGYLILSLGFSGWILGSLSKRLAGALLVFSYAVASFAWVMPVLALRRAEANPVWAALLWVVRHQPQQPVWVESGISPHGEALLEPLGYTVQQKSRRELGKTPGLWVVSPAPRDKELLFHAHWWEPRMGEMTRRRYLSAAVLKVAPKKGSKEGMPPPGLKR